MTEDRFCDQEDCPNYFYEKEVRQTATQVIESRGFYTQYIKAWNTNVNMSQPDSSDGMVVMGIKIKKECLMCSYLKRCDMKTELKIAAARNALEGK